MLNKKIKAHMDLTENAKRKGKRHENTIFSKATTKFEGNSKT